MTEHELQEPEGGWLVTLGDLDYRDGKAPTQAFGGWNVDDGPAPSGRQACWGHDGTHDLSDEDLSRVAEALEENGRTAFLLDIDGANLLVLDMDLDAGADDPAAGKWGDRGNMLEFAREHFPEGTFWHTQSGGLHVPVLLTDEAYEAVFRNRFRPGFGVDALKGPAGKGYTAAPLSPGYGVERSGDGWPVLGLDDLRGSELFVEADRPAASSPTADFEPVKSREEAHSLGSTADVQDVLDAINQLRPGDFDEGFVCHGDRGDGTVLYDPSPYRPTSTGESLAYLPERGVWYDMSLGVGMFADKLVALDEGIVSSPHDALEGGDWWEAVDELRDRGAPVPEYEPGEAWEADLESTADMEAGDEALLWDIRRDYQAQHEAAVDGGYSGHLVGPKGAGKTHNAVRTALDEPVFLAMPTKEKYEDALEQADELGIDAMRLPSFPEHSPLHDAWEPEYELGAFPREIYAWEDGDPGDDPYRELSDRDFSEYDLLVGSPQHAFMTSVTEDRVVFFDDADLEAYKHTLDRGVKDDLNALLESVDHPAASWTQLDDSTDWHRLEAAIMDEVNDVGGEDVWDRLERLSEEEGIDRRGFLASLPGVSLEVVDWARALTGNLHSSDAYQDRGMRLVACEAGRMLVKAPDLSGAAQVFTMGAWPAEGLGQMFDDMLVTFDGMYGCARHGEMERAINRVVIQTSEHVHNKSSGNERPEKIEALADSVERLGAELGINEAARVFSTKREVDRVEGGENYAALVGTNDYGSDHLAVAGASQHYGDAYVKLRAAYAGSAPEDPAEGDPYDPRRWLDETHAAIEQRMRRSGVYEAITRMGRNDTDLTIVAADTAELPDWLRVVDQSSKVAELSESARALYDYVKASDGPAFVKDGEGGGAVEDLDYSGPALYAARDRLLEEGLIEPVAEGAYGSQGYGDAADGGPGSRGIMGLQKSRLPGSALSEASNPDWDVERLETAGAGPTQGTLGGAGWST